jgi:hypothetical protein
MACDATACVKVYAGRRRQGMRKRKKGAGGRAETTSFLRFRSSPRIPSFGGLRVPRAGLFLGGRLGPLGRTLGTSARHLPLPGL